MATCVGQRGPEQEPTNARLSFCLSSDDAVQTQGLGPQIHRFSFNLSACLHSGFVGKPMCTSLGVRRTHTQEPAPQRKPPSVRSQHTADRQCPHSLRNQLRLPGRGAQCLCLFPFPDIKSAWQGGPRISAPLRGPLEGNRTPSITEALCSLWGDVVRGAGYSFTFKPAVQPATLW